MPLYFARKSLALNGVAVAVQRAIKTGCLSDQGVPDPTGSIVAPVVGTQQFAPKLRCELDDSRAPRPRPKEVLMRVRASSLNYRDLMVLKGGGRGPTNSASYCSPTAPARSLRSVRASHAPRLVTR